MDAAETQLARALATLVARDLPLSRDLETRLDAYLQLEELLRLEDSEASVRQLQTQVPALLLELRLDLQRRPLRDVLLAALRCLSYLMHHRSLAAAFPAEQARAVLAELVQLLFSTQDQSTYKLCLWCLSVQNFPAETHTSLPRIVEGLVQAVVNPFKSRAIEVQALKGLLLLLVKYPQQVAEDAAVLNIWVRPIASRLSSSEAATRTQARLVLEEASKHRHKWSQETRTMVQDCAVKYMLPVMKTHMDRDRQKDAVYLWQLTLVLLKSRFSADLAMLNEVLYVPEKCMEDEDAAVRLMTMQAWAELVDIFHESKDWLFKKAVVNLLVWPINECLKQERLLNVADAAFTSWQKIVCVAVQDFNEFCNSNDTTAQCLPAWRKWLGELVILPVLTVMQKRDVSVGKPSTIELERFVKFVKKVWEPAGHEYGNSKEKAIPARNESSSSTTMGGSSTDGSVGTKKHVHAQNSMSRLQVDSVALLKILDELSLTREPNCRPITSKLVGLAFLLEDVSSAVQNLIEASDDIREEHNKRLGNELVMTIWKGFCQRIHSSDAQNDALSSNVSKASKLKLRAMRMSIDFAFGILVSRSNEACAPVSTEVLTLLDQAGQKPEVVVASVGFGLEWQLKLLAPLVSGVTHAGDLQVVMLHSKSKLFEHIARRMDYLKDMYTQCTTVMQKWEDSKAGELLVDFSSKTNVLPYVLLNLLFEYAVFVDDTNNNYGCGQQATLLNLDIVVKKLVESAKSSGQQKSRGLSTLLRFSEDAIQAAHYLFDDEAGGSEKISMLNTLTTILSSSSEHSYESQQNASLLLDLHQSKGNPIASSAITASSAEFSATSNTNEKTAVHGSDFVSASLDTSTSSPCLLSGEILAISNVSSDPMSKDARSTKKGSGLNCSPDADAVNNKFDGSPSTLTPRKADISEQNKTAKIQLQPAGSQSAPPKLVSTQSGGHSKRLTLDTAQCIYPDLVGCAESIASLYRHFPMGFRPFFSFYKVKTIGDLSALPIERVRTFGLKEPVSTVRRALEEYNGRKDRMKSLTGSPFRQRSGSMSTSPAIPTPPSHKPSKRPFNLECGGTALLPLEKRQHKRTKRSLLLDEDGGDDGEEESEGTRRKPKLADRVTFCLQSGDAGETRITRPGEDSQDQLKPSEKANEKESVQEKMDTYTLKLLQHLRRSTHYMDKLVTEEESLQSQEESLQASIATVGGVITNYQEAHNLILRLTAQLQVAAEASSKRCNKLLHQRGQK